MLRFGGLAVIFGGFISHLIGRETINIPEIFSGVHGFTGKTLNQKKKKKKTKLKANQIHQNLHTCQTRVRIVVTGNATP